MATARDRHYLLYSLHDGGAACSVGATLAVALGLA